MSGWLERRRERRREKRLRHAEKAMKVPPEVQHRDGAKTGAIGPKTMPKNPNLWH